MKTVWILFSVVNDYNQPEKAFEKIYWHKPTYEDLMEYGFSSDEANKECPYLNKVGSVEYWIESFTES